MTWLQILAQAGVMATFVGVAIAVAAYFNGKHIKEGVGQLGKMIEGLGKLIEEGHKELAEIIREEGRQTRELLAKMDEKMDKMATKMDERTEKIAELIAMIPQKTVMLIKEKGTEYKTDK
ncbi:MAG: hypothetical protein AB1349_05310 [Elusimicrobiota bacterium]